VFATATDRGEYSTFANASASVQNPNGLGIRASGSSGPFEVTWSTFCDGVARLRAGQVVVVGVAQSAKCTVNGSVQGSKSGSARVELLRR